MEIVAAVVTGVVYSFVKYAMWEKLIANRPDLSKWEKLAYMLGVLI